MKNRRDLSLSKSLNGRFSQKQDEMPREPGIMGSEDGKLKVPNLDGYVYVTIGDKTVPVYNSLVAPRIGLKVWVGRSPIDRTIYQVLGTRSDKPTGGVVGTGGYAPSSYYEWMAKNGGQDPLHVHLRAISYLKSGISPNGGMNVQLYKGFVNSGGTMMHVDTQDVDISAHIPTVDGNAAMVLITIDNTGAVVQTKGTEFVIADIDYGVLPTVPADTVFVSSAVRVYYGQTKVQETKTNRDIVDLRFTGLNWGGGAAGTAFDIPIVTSDPVTPGDGEMWLLRETTGAIPNGTPIGLLLALTYTGNTGSTAPLQLSAWDDDANTIIRYASL